MIADSNAASVWGWAQHSFWVEEKDLAENLGLSRQLWGQEMPRENQVETMLWKIWSISQFSQIYPHVAVVIL